MYRCAELNISLSNVTGILEGMKVLQESGGTVGSSMIVVSDGGENVSPLIDAITQQVTLKHCYLNYYLSC